MDVITIESQAYKSLEQKIDKIAEFIDKADNPQQNQESDLSGVKLSTEEICDILDVSPRTLQRLRAEGRLYYYIDKGKCIYKFEDIEELVNDKVLPTTIKTIPEFHKSYQNYAK